MIQRAFLFAVALVSHSLLFAGNTGFNPSPVSTFDGSPVTIVGEVTYSQLPDPGGVAIATYGTDYYIASGSKITKFDVNGTQVWERSYSYSSVTITGENPVTNYYESWGDGTDISPGTGTDDGEIMTPTAQRALTDTVGNLYVYFLDGSRPYRGLVVKFSAAGNLIWRHPTSYPLAPLSNGSYTTEGEHFMLDFVFSADGDALAVLEVFTYGDLYNSDTGTTLEASVMTRVTVFDTTPTGTSGNGEYLLNPTQYGAQSKRAYGVGLARNTSGTFYFATQEGPTGQPLQEASELIFRSIPSPFTAISATVNTFSSDHALEEWNDIGFGQDGNIYLGGTSPSGLGRTHPRQIIGSFTGTALAERWTTEIAPSLPFDNVENGALGLEIMIFGDDGVYVAGDTNRDPSSRLALAKVDYSGTQLWSINTYDVDNGGETKAYSPRMDLDGNIYFVGATGTNTFELWKFSPSGLFQFTSVQTAPDGESFNQGAVAIVSPAQYSTATALFAGMASRQGFNTNPHTFKMVKFTNTDNVKAPNEITVNVAPFEFVHRGDVVEFSSTSSSGLPVTYSIQSGTASVSGNQVTYSTVGTVTVRVSQAGNDMFEAATPVDVTVDVIEAATKGTQSISFAAISTKEFSTSPFRISASASSGLPVSFSVSGAASISGNTITMKNLGTVRVTAIQSGNGAYHAASSVTRSFVVRDSKDPSISGVKSSGKTSGSSYSITGTASDNHQVVALKYRVKPPGGKFSAFKSVSFKTKIGDDKRFAVSVPVSAPGKHVVELFAEDKSGNKSSSVKVTVTRQE